jgi:hypothetical protein
VEELRAKLVMGEIVPPSTVEQDVVFAGAVQALPRRGSIYRAACRHDEILYAETASTSGALEPEMQLETFRSHKTCWSRTEAAPLGWKMQGRFC